MPDTRSRRGPDPRDIEAFDPTAWPALREAVADLSWLLGRGYAPVSALKLVGDRFSLTARQRAAVLRGSCSDAARDRRRRLEVPAEALRGSAIVIDGFNVLTTVETALGGGVVLRGRDGVDRDLAGVHGTYRKVEETVPAIRLVGSVLAELGVSRSLWLLDRPVSNSGRLRGLILDEAAGQIWSCAVELPFDPDPLLADSDEIIATADSVVLDRCHGWFNLARETIERHVPSAWIIDFTDPIA